MFSEIKNYIKELGLAIWGLLTAIFGVALFFLYKKNKEVEAYKAQVALADTQKKVDVLDAQIEQHKQENAQTQKEILELEKVQKDIESKRQELQKQEDKATDKEIEDFWSKK